MIAKKVANPSKSASKQVRIARLLAYIYAPEREDRTEKCAYAGGRGFICDSTAGRIAEMAAVADGAVRSRDPIEHYVFSWQADEHPSAAQIEAAMDLLEGELNLPGHQLAYALHTDTGNDHLHVVVNRVDPDTLKPGRINRGFDVDAIQRAAARIEHAQGWAADANKRWAIGAGGQPVPARPDPQAPARPARDRPQRASQAVQDEAHRRGEPSMAERAAAALGPAIAAADSWPALHAALAEHGATYARRGGGAVIEWRGVRLKASVVRRDASLRKLEQRFGEPFQGNARPDSPAPEPAGDPRDAATPIRAARTWAELHAELARRGLRYRRKGSGARISGAGGDWKASDVHRQATPAALEKRLGAWQAPEAPESVVEALSAPAAAVRPGTRAPAPGAADAPRTAQGDADPADGAAQDAPQAAVQAPPAPIEGGWDRTPAPTPTTADAPPTAAEDPIADPAAVARPIIAAAGTWGELHARLAAERLRYERKGSGARLRGPGVDIKASALDRKASLGRLERRLGPWEPPAGRPDAPAAAPGGGETPYETWRRHGREHRERRRRQRLAADLELDQEEAELKKKQARDRRALEDDFRRRRKGRQRNASRSLLAFAQAQARADLADRRRAARAAAAGEAWPTFGDWKRDRERDETEQRWPWAHRTAHRTELTPAAPDAVQCRPLPPQDLRSYHGEIDPNMDDVARYTHIDSGRVDFKDFGSRIAIRAGASRDQHAVLAALQLAATRYRRVTINGRRAFQQLAVRTALSHGIRISDHGIEDILAAERERQQFAKAEWAQAEGHYTRTDAGKPRPELRRGPDGQQLELWAVAADGRENRVLAASAGWTAAEAAAAITDSAGDRQRVETELLADLERREAAPAAEPAPAAPERQGRGRGGSGHGR